MWWTVEPFADLKLSNGPEKRPAAPSPMCQVLQSALTLPKLGRGTLRCSANVPFKGVQRARGRDPLALSSYKKKSLS